MSVIANNQERWQRLLPQLTRYSAGFPMSRKNFLYQIFAASQTSFPKVKPGPIVLIGSDGDRLVNPNCTLKIAKAWGLKARMHPNAGHDIPIDDPDWLLDQLM